MLRLAILPAILAMAFSPLKSMSEEINVYSYRQPELVKPLFDEFTRRTGIEVSYIFINKGLTERLKAEGSRSPADLVMTVDISRLSDLAAAGLTQPIPASPAISEIPESLRDPAGHWIALTTRARIAYVSKERVRPGEITTYEDLASPKWKGRICSRAGTHSYNLALFAAVIRHHGERKAEDWLGKLKANLGRRPQGNDRSQVKAIWAGQCDIAIGNTYYMGKMLENPEQRAWASAVRIEFPKFEGGGTHVNISGVAMTKASRNRESALRLVEFLVSPDGQGIYAAANYEYPVTPGIAHPETVRAWGDFSPDMVSLEDLAKLRPKALALVEKVGFDR